jgi:hypothetical protein
LELFMSAILTDENERDCAWESGLSPNARAVGLVVVLVAALLFIPYRQGIPVCQWGYQYVTGEVVGGMVTLDGQPLIGAELHLRVPEPLGHGEWAISDPREGDPRYEHHTKVMPNGNYRFYGVYAGVYVLSVEYHSQLYAVRQIEIRKGGKFDLKLRSLPKPMESAVAASRNEPPPSPTR